MGMRAVRQQVKALTEINIQDMLTSFGLGDIRRGRSLLNFTCWVPARRFAQQVSAYDSLVATAGLRAASTQLLRSFTNKLEVVGQENIPEQGAVLILSNHPGLADTLALFASIPRTDLRCVAAVRPFLKALTNVEPYLIYVGDGPKQRVSAVRSVVKHLEGGGTVLTFPAGEIEPDPACMPGAVEALQKWSQSIGIFMRRVPALKIVPTIVSGVIWPAALHAPVTRLRRSPKDRERLAAALQILVQSIFPFVKPVAIQVTFGEALSIQNLPDCPDAACITDAVMSRVHYLIEQASQKPVSALKVRARAQASPIGGVGQNPPPTDQANFNNAW
jgi:hypothetical protein